MTSSRLFVILGAASAFLAVAAGAFGAHALRAKLTPAMLVTFETGVRYQMYHALALLFVGWALARWGGSLLAGAGWAFVLGTVLFSGSLYALALSGVRGLGMITPLGGIAFLLGWVLVILGVIRVTE